MRRLRIALLVATSSALVMVAADARAQLVPLSECGSAIPCSIPKGLRPADAAALSPYSRVGNGNALVGVALNPSEGFKPEVMSRSIAEDPSDRAARIFLKKNPGFAMPRTAPTPSATDRTAPTPPATDTTAPMPSVTDTTASPAAAPEKKPEAKAGTGAKSVAPTAASAPPAAQPQQPPPQKP